MSGSHKKYSVQMLTGLSTEMLTVMVRSIVLGWQSYNSGRLLLGTVPSGASPATESIEGNIEAFIASALVYGICFQVEIALILAVKRPVNRAFVNGCQQSF